MQKLLIDYGVPGTERSKQFIEVQINNNELYKIKQNKTNKKTIICQTGLS